MGSAKEHLSAKLQYLTEFLGGSYEEQGDYPAWEYRKDSKLRDLMQDTFKEMFGKEPHVGAIHAGLECGLFAKKIPGLDLISLGPNMYDVHTPDERLSISSTIRIWEYLKLVLARLK